MNLKIILAATSIVTFSFAQEPAAVNVPETSANVAFESVENPTEPAQVAPTPVAETSESVSVVEAQAPAAEPQTAEPKAVEPVAESAADPAAPVAVRGGEAPAKSVQETQVEAVPVAEPLPVAEPAGAPKAVRQNASAPSENSTSSETVYVQKVYVSPTGVPVRTVYVAQTTGKDTVSMDELMGRYPMTFKLGVHGSINAYYMSNGSDTWDGESFDGISWRAGVSALIPLNDYTMGLRLGVLYEQSRASESYYVNKVPTLFKFEQKKLDIPVLFTFKSAGSRFFFDMGAQVSIPLQDELRVSFTEDDKKVKSKMDLIDEDYRNTVDWSLVFGFSVLANKYISLDVRAEIGLSDLYDGYLNLGSADMDMNLSASSFGVGLTLYPF